MRVAVDQDRCRGHGICCATCPEVFTLTDDGYSEVSEPVVPAGFEQAVRAAADSCPERAIAVA